MDDEKEDTDHHIHMPGGQGEPGEADIMGTILQKLGELGAYDINLKASSTEVREPAAPKVRETGPQIPAFLQERRSRPSRREVPCLPGGGSLWERDIGIPSRPSGG
ncbi:MAG: hypothetical protein ACLRZZ_14330 [Enterocloster sp.]